MDFKDYNKKIQTQFEKMCQTGKLFKSVVQGSAVWDMYITSFDEEDNKIFRDPESSEHNCNCCKSFIKRYGNIVAINDEGNLESIFFGITEVGEYTNSTLKCAELLENCEISDVFIESYNTLDKLLNYESCSPAQDSYKLGIESNFKRYTEEEVEKYGGVNAEDIYEFDHFNLQLPKLFVDFSHRSVEAIQANYRDKYSVFKRAMEEIPLDTLNLVKDLINQGSLLDGTAHLHSVKEILAHKEEYDKWIGKYPLKNTIWGCIYDMDEIEAKFKNTLIGVLCTELAEGMELNKACENWNKRVDPANYHKATAPITQKQIKEAQKFCEENGYVEAFNRTFATLGDIKASEIKHINGDGSERKEISIFDNVKATSTRHKRAEFDKLEEVSIDKFMDDILPACTEVEAYFNNGVINNLVAMTKPVSDNFKNIFKWNNGYSWTFNGNLAGKSQIKQAVKDAGGNIEGVLNFRLMWNDGDVKNDNSDLDIWAIEPDGNKIGFSTPYRKDKLNKRSKLSGQLDVDNTSPSGKIAVENITWVDKQKMSEGTYKLSVNQYSSRNSRGFKAEVEFENETYRYEYNQPVSGYVNVAEVTLKDGKFTIKHLLPLSSSALEPQERWGIETESFHKVNLICKSPNHWNDNNVGNLHYFFMLNNCKADTSIRTFHNENLIPELLKHKKVMEVLGATSMLEPAENQLAGIGFNSTVKDELIVKVKGSFKRMLKIKF